MNMGKAPEFMSHHRSQLRRLKPRLLPTLDGYHRQVAHILVSAADAFNRDERSRPRGGDLRKHARQAVHGVQRANKEHFHVDGHRPASTDLRRVLYFLLWARGYGPCAFTAARARVLPVITSATNWPPSARPNCEFARAAIACARRNMSAAIGPDFNNACAPAEFIFTRTLDISRPPFPTQRATTT